MTDVPKRFAEHLEALTALGSPIARYLRPGRPPDDVRSALGRLDLTPAGEVIDWFASFDGPDDASFARDDPDASALELFHAVRPLTLDQATALATSLRQDAEDLGEEGEAFWRRSWVPLLLGPGSGFAVECGPNAAQATVPVWRVLSHPGPAETGLVADSLADLLQRWTVEVTSDNVYWHAESRTLQPADDQAIRLERDGLI